MKGLRGVPLTTTQRQEEVRQFFCIAAELRNPETSDDRLVECLDEIEIISMRTPSPMVRQRCYELLAELYDPDQRSKDGTA